MTIKTLSDWNAHLAMSSCCEMPQHPKPRIEVETIHVSAKFRYTSYTPGGAYARTMRQSWSDGGYLIIEINQAWQAYTDSREIPPLYHRSVREAGPKTGKASISYSNLISPAQAASQAENAIRQGVLESDYEIFQAPVAGGIIHSSYRLFNEFGPYTGGALGWLRFRIHPPEEFRDGSYCKVTYDRMLLRPDQWYFEGTLLEGGSVEFTTNQPSDWIVLEPPTEDADIYIVNIAYTSYRSPYGSKPSYYSVWP